MKVRSQRTIYQPIYMAQTMTKTLSTTLHRYSFDTSDEKSHAEYRQLKKQLTETHGQCFRVYGDPIKHIDGHVFELETNHVFSNQWNTACGHRIMEWYERIVRNRSIRCGYWIDVTQAMQEVKRNTLNCGYCSNSEPAAKGLTFCDECLGSEYLKSINLHLTRLIPAEIHMPDRLPLTDRERAERLPRYREAQTRRRTKNETQTRARIAADCAREIARAETERNGFLWLLDHDIAIENCIYYKHTDKFSFGWRAPVDAAVVSALLDVISEFPFAYEIKCADGRKLEGN